MKVKSLQSPQLDHKAHLNEKMGILSWIFVFSDIDSHFSGIYNKDFHPSTFSKFLNVLFFFFLLILGRAGAAGFGVGAVGGML